MVGIHQWVVNPFMVNALYGYNTPWYSCGSNICMRGKSFYGYLLNLGNFFVGCDTLQASKPSSLSTPVTLGS